MFHQLSLNPTWASWQDLQWGTALVEMWPRNYETHKINFLQKTSIHGWYLRRHVKQGPHDKQCDWSVGSFENVFRVIVSFVVVVRLLNLTEQLVSVLQTTFLTSQFLHTVKLIQCNLNNFMMLCLQCLVIDIGPDWLKITFNLILINKLLVSTTASFHFTQINLLSRS